MRAKPRYVKAWLWILTDEKKHSIKKAIGWANQVLGPQFHRCSCPWQPAHRNQVFTFWYNKSPMSLQSCSRSQLRSSGPGINLAQVLDLGPISRKGEYVSPGARTTGRVSIITCGHLGSPRPAPPGLFCFLATLIAVTVSFYGVELSWHLWRCQWNRSRVKLMHSSIFLILPRLCSFSC